MKGFQELDVVKVVKLLTPARTFESSDGVGRAPAVGDTGAVVAAHGNSSTYIVERVSPDGRTVWLADFDIEELELV